MNLEKKKTVWPLTQNSSPKCKFRRLKEGNERVKTYFTKFTTGLCYSGHDPPNTGVPNVANDGCIPFRCAGIKGAL